MATRLYNTILETVNNLHDNYGFGCAQVVKIPHTGIIHATYIKGDCYLVLIYDSTEREILALHKNGTIFRKPKNILDVLLTEKLSLNCYLVTLIICVDGYEKSIKHCVKALNAEDAEYKALCDETHNEPLTREQYCNDEEWYDDCMLYQLYSVENVSEDFFKTFHSIK